MGILRKKKKVKAKKPMTTERFTKIILPILFVGIIVFSVMRGGFDCGIPISQYTDIINELSNPFDVGTMLGGNPVLVSDKQTLKEKVGGAGADLNIILDGQIVPELYNDAVILTASQDLTLTDVEMAQFCNIVWNDNSEVRIEILELSIDARTDDYLITMVYNINISKLTEQLSNGLEKIENLYIKSESVAQMIDGELVISSSSSQINALTKKNNDELVAIVNSLVGYAKDAGVEMYASEINNMANKIDAEVIIDTHSIKFDI